MKKLLLADFIKRHPGTVETNGVLVVKGDFEGIADVDDEDDEDDDED